MNNQERKIRPGITHFNSYAPSFYPYSIKVNKSSGSCYNINDSYARLCVPDVIKKINVKVFNLISRTNEVRHIKWHETCCNNIKDSYARLCVPDVIKKINVKVFNLISRTNEVRHIKWHETCKYKCRLDATVCNKHRWNNVKCSCECKELVDKGICDKGFILNPSNCEYECDQSCDVEEY